MNNYNLTVLINNKVDEKGRESLINGLKKDFGTLVKEDLWGVRSLAYEIKHMDKAYFAHFEFESEPETVLTLDKNIRLNEDIIRYLLVRSKKAKRVSVGQAKRAAAKAEVKTEKVEAEAVSSGGGKVEAKEEKAKDKTEEKSAAPAAPSKAKKVVIKARKKE